MCVCVYTHCTTDDSLIMVSTISLTRVDSNTDDTRVSMCTCPHALAILVELITRVLRMCVFDKVGRHVTRSPVLSLL